MRRRLITLRWAGWCERISTGVVRVDRLPPHTRGDAEWVRIGLVCGGPLQATTATTLGVLEPTATREHIQGLASGLAALGHEVRLFHPPVAPGQFLADTTDPNEPAATPASVVRPVGEQAQQVWRAHWRPDVVHAHGWLAGLIAHVGARDLPIPITISFHGIARGIDGTDTQRQRLERSLARSSAIVLATSSSEVSEVMRWGIMRNRIAMVPTGVDIEHFTRPTSLEAIRTPAHGLRVLTMTTVDDVAEIALVAQMLTRIPEATWTIGVLGVDGHPDGLVVTPEDSPRQVALEWIEDLVVDHGLVSRAEVVAHAHASIRPQMYREADVLVHVPARDAVGTICLEAMASGCTVIATSAGAPGDMIVDGVTGLLLPHRRLDTLVVAVRRLLHEPFAAAAMGIAARDRAVTRYPWERVTQETLDVYERVLSSASVAESSPPPTSP